VTLIRLSGRISVPSLSFGVKYSANKIDREMTVTISDNIGVYMSVDSHPSK